MAKTRWMNDMLGHTVGGASRPSPLYTGPATNEGLAAEIAALSSVIQFGTPNETTQRRYHELCDERDRRAAITARSKAAELYPYDGGDPDTITALRSAFRAGAEWQAEHSRVR